MDVGAQGRASDGGVFAASTLSQAMESGALNLPPPACPPNSNVHLPFVLVGDEAFPLKTNVMRPYPQRTLNHERRVSTRMHLVNASHTRCTH